MGFGPAPFAPLLLFRAWVQDFEFWTWAFGFWLLAWVVSIVRVQGLSQGILGATMAVNPNAETLSPHYVCVSADDLNPDDLIYKNSRGYGSKVMYVLCIYIYM